MIKITCKTNETKNVEKNRNLFTVYIRDNSIYDVF